MECKLEVVRFDAEDVIATSGVAPAPVPGFFDMLPEGAPTTYQGFQKLTNLQKIQLLNALGEDDYAAYVAYLQTVYTSGAIEFGD